MSEHTPTPWRVFTNPDGTKLVGIGGQDGQGILDAGFGVWSWNDPEGIANAHLVVEAVNNYAELKKQLVRMRAALEPFAKAGQLFKGDHAEFNELVYGPAAGNEYNITGDHLRAARLALTDDLSKGE